MNHTESIKTILPYAEELPIHLLAAIFKDKNQSYKLFWFDSIVDKISEGQIRISYDELMDKMIVKAWYMVMEYHLNLGPRDAIEIVINQIRDTYHFKSNEKEEIILAYLKNSSDKSIKDAKKKLVQNVPYRLQKPFLGNITEKDWNNYNHIALSGKRLSAVMK